MLAKLYLLRVICSRERAADGTSGSIKAVSRAVQNVTGTGASTNCCSRYGGAGRSMLLCLTVHESGATTNCRCEHEDGGWEPSRQSPSSGMK